MFEDCLYFNTTALARLVEKQWHDAFKKIDLTPSQAFMLRLILKKYPLAQQEIAQQLGIAKATATSILHSSEQKGFIKREISAYDARITLIHAMRKAQLIGIELDQRSQIVTKKIKNIIGNKNFQQTVSQIKHIRDTLY